MTRFSFTFTSYAEFAATVPVPRIFADIVPDVTVFAATSGRERFMIVFEKKVSKSMIAKNIMAAFLIQPLLFPL